MKCGTWEDISAVKNGLSRNALTVSLRSNFQEFQALAMWSEATAVRCGHPGHETAHV